MKQNYTCTIYVKNGRTWDVCRVETDTAKVYEMLAQNLINKKLCACTYIRSISRQQNYNGTQAITIIFTNNVKHDYIVAAY